MSAAEILAYIMPIAVLFGLLFFSIFRGGLIVSLAVIALSVGLVLSELYGVWLDVVFGLMIVWGIAGLLKSVKVI